MVPVKADQIYNCDGIRAMEKIPDGSFDLLLTDPPYGVSRKLNCKGQRLGSTAKLDFEFGKWDIDADTEWADVALPKTSGWAVIFCAKQDIGAYWRKMERHGFRAVDAIVWQKPDPLPLNGKTKLLNAWESAVIGKRDGAFFGGHCVHNVFMYQAPKGDSRIHPTQKPLGLVKDLVELTTQKGHRVLDVFMGSGTTAVACAQTGRHYVGFEIDKKYCKAARARVLKEIRSHKIKAVIPTPRRPRSSRGRPLRR